MFDIIIINIIFKQKVTPQSSWSSEYGNSILGQALILKI